MMMSQVSILLSLPILFERKLEWEKIRYVQFVLENKGTCK